MQSDVTRKYEIIQQLSPEYMEQLLELLADGERVSVIWETAWELTGETR